MKTTDIKEFERRNNIELPKDEISEVGVIGSILVHPEYILKSDFLKPNLFYDRSLGCIYYIVSELLKKNAQNIDSFLIINEIEGSKGFKSAFEENGITDISDFLDDLKLVARNAVEDYSLLSEKVITCSFKRASYIKLFNLAKDVIKSKETVNEANYKLQQEIQDFSKGFIYDSETDVIGNMVDTLMSSIERKQQTGFFGFPSKFSEINNYFTYELTELVLICAKKKVGKSSLLMNEAVHKAMSGVPTLYIDREMSEENHFIRMLAMLSGVDNRKIKKGTVSLQEKKRVEEAKEYIKTLPYIHKYMPVASIDETVMFVKSMQLKYGIEFVVFDYIKANQGGDSDKEYQVLGRWTDCLKNDIAGAMNLAVLSSAQLDDNENKIADSQKIARNCSTIAWLRRKSKEMILEEGRDAGNMYIEIKDNRNGDFTPEGEHINVVLDGSVCTMTQAKIPFSCADNTTPFDEE